MPYRIIWSWYTGRWWVGCYVWYSDEGTGRGPSPPRPLIAVPNVTAHPSTASVPITVLLYNDALLCGFNVSIKELKVKYNTKCKYIYIEHHEVWRCRGAPEISKQDQSPIQSCSTCSPSCAFNMTLPVATYKCHNNFTEAKLTEE